MRPWFAAAPMWQRRGWRAQRVAWSMLPAAVSPKRQWPACRGVVKTALAALTEAERTLGQTMDSGLAVMPEY